MCAVLCSTVERSELLLRQGAGDMVRLGSGELWFGLEVGFFQAGS